MRALKGSKGSRTSRCRYTASERQSWPRCGSNVFAHACRRTKGCRDTRFREVNSGVVSFGHNWVRNSGAGRADACGSSRSEFRVRRCRCVIALYLNGHGFSLVFVNRSFFSSDCSSSNCLEAMTSLSRKGSDLCTRYGIGDPVAPGNVLGVSGSNS